MQTTLEIRRRTEISGTGSAIGAASSTIISRISEKVQSVSVRGWLLTGCVATVSALCASVAMDAAPTPANAVWLAVSVAVGVTSFICADSKPDEK